jgi:hypothetical protein
MLLASPRASTRAAHFHGLHIVNASRIAVLFGVPIQSAPVVETGFLPNEVEPAAQGGAHCHSSREAYRWFCKYRAEHINLFAST